MDVLMPQLGETVTEGKITKWFKSAGDTVAPGDNLFEIETDKVSMEVPATTAGVLSEVRVPVGEVAAVGAVVAVISDGAAARAPAGQAVRSVGPLPNPPPQAVEGMTAPQAVEGITTPQAGEGIRLDPFLEVRTPARNYGPARLPGGRTVTPLARRLAAEAGIDLGKISSSGPHDRIVARDLEAALRASAKAAPSARVPVAGAEQIKALYRDVPFDEVPLDGMRRTIAARLTEAKQTIPHFYLTADVEIGALLALREQANAGAPKDREGKPAFRLSVNDFIIKAWAAALARVPAANAAWAEDRILRFSRSDIAVAVAFEGGLLTPIIRDAQSKTLSAISSEMRDLAARARERRLRPSEYQGGSSVVSNLGMHGVREFSAIINPPHATVLAIGAARRQPVENRDGGIAFISVMSVTLSSDHRVVDGALGAELVAAFKTLVEQPVTMLV
jgi:pyruvate dehydrogenase E2 component (dihydrolipoamide acetyltransferase)